LETVPNLYSRIVASWYMVSFQRCLDVWQKELYKFSKITLGQHHSNHSFSTLNRHPGMAALKRFGLWNSPRLPLRRYSSTGNSWCEFHSLKMWGKLSYSLDGNNVNNRFGDCVIKNKCCSNLHFNAIPAGGHLLGFINNFWSNGPIGLNISQFSKNYISRIAYFEQVVWLEKLNFYIKKISRKNRIIYL